MAITTLAIAVNVLLVLINRSMCAKPQPDDEGKAEVMEVTWYCIPAPQR